jgi:hypothetical protein
MHFSVVIVFVNEHKSEFLKRNISMLGEYSIGISANTQAIMTEGSLFLSSSGCVHG